MCYFGLDTRALQMLRKEMLLTALWSKLDTITEEHNDTYIEGIQSVFEPLKHVTSTPRGIGFTKMPSLCGMTLFKAASPPSIMISQRNECYKQSGGQSFPEYMLTTATHCGKVYKLGKDLKLIGN